MWKESAGRLLGCRTASYICAATMYASEIFNHMDWRVDSYSAHWTLDFHPCRYALHQAICRGILDVEQFKDLKRLQGDGPIHI
jgi:hypothetical protein